MLYMLRTIAAVRDAIYNRNQLRDATYKLTRFLKTIKLQYLRKTVSQE